MSNDTNETQEQPLLQWTSFPLRDYPKSSILLAVFMVFLAVLLWQIAVVEWEMPLFYVLGMLLVLGNLAPYYIPTRYKLFETRVDIEYLSIKISRKYSDFHCFYADKKGIMLGTFPQPNRLDRFRGQSLRFSKDRHEREELESILTKKIGAKF